MKRLQAILILFAVVVYTITSLVIAPWGQASEPQENPGIKLEEIVVTATKTGKTIDNAPGSISVVTGKDIELRNIKTVDESLNIVTGVYRKRTKGLMDTTSSVNLRGFKGDQYNLILLDGQPLNDAHTGGLEWAALPIDNIDRIEVTRGAASALYGGNAMGGVINIITRTPEKMEANISAGYGTHNTQRYHLNAGNRFFDKLSLHVGYEEESTNGYETTPVVRTIQSGAGTECGGYPMEDKFGNFTKWVVGDNGKNNAERQSIDAKAVFDFSDTGNLSFTVVSGKHEYDYDPPNTYMETFTGSAVVGTDQSTSFNPNNFIDYTGIGRNETDVYTLSFKEVFGSWQIDGQIGLVKTDDNYTTESGGSATTYYNSSGTLKITETEAFFSEIRASAPLGSSHILTTGVSCRTDKSDTNDYEVSYYRSFECKSTGTFYSGGKDLVSAIFLQDEWNVVEPLTLYIGARYDWWKVYDGTSGEPGYELEYASNKDSLLNPKVSAVWKAFKNTTFRASAGRAFRPPTLYELYRTWTSWGYTYQSNPNLEPEKVWTYEIGIAQYLFDGKVRLSLTGYQNDIDDLIYYKIDEMAKTRTRSNAGKGRTCGLEFEVSHQFNNIFRIWSNYTFTNAKIIENPADPASEGKRITGVPRNLLNLGIEAESRWLKGSIAGRYSGKIYNSSDNKDSAEGVYGTYEPSCLVDFKITVMPCKWVDISFSVDNVFDKEYYQYYKGDGRTYFAELALKY